MRRYPYVVVGGGIAADAAVRGIRRMDREHPIALFSAEAHPPYNRPPLSKGLWQGKPLADIWRGTEELGVDLFLGRTIRSLDPAARRVVDDRGEEVAFERLLLATGGTPRRLLGSGPDDPVVYFRTLDDYQRLRGLAERGGRFAVLGGGFIGSEMAAALASNGCSVVMLFPEAGVGARVFPPDLAAFVTDYYRKKGVEVRAGEAAARVERRGDRAVVHTDTGQTMEADSVVAGLGLVPRTEVAQAGGLPVDDGIVVDEHLRAGHPDIYAAGDVTRFYAPALGLRLRVEHEDNANTQGRMAGENMAGADRRYDHLPFFYSDLFDLGYEAVGVLDSRLETFSDWQEPYRKGVVYYLEGRRVRGVLLWNVWGKVDAARSLIARPGPFTEADLTGAIA